MSRFEIFSLFYVLSAEVDCEAEISTQMTFHSKLTQKAALFLFNYLMNKKKLYE